MIPATVLNTPTVLNNTHGTHDNPHGTQDIPHSTQDIPTVLNTLHGTQDIPPQYSRYPSMVLKISPTVLLISPMVLNTPYGTEHPHGTAHALYRVKYERGWGKGGLQQSNSIRLLVKIKLKQNQNNWSGNWS